MRRSVLIWSVLCAAVVVGLFVVKHRVQALEENLQALNAEIISDKNAIQVLEAEWSFLNQPARLEELSRRLLGMDAPQPEQTMLLREFLETAPDRTPEQTPDGTQVATGPAAPAEPKPATDPGLAAAAIRVQAAAPSATVAPIRDGDVDWLTPIMAKLKKSQ